MTKVIIIGGGFAGLSAGTALAELGYQVTLLEGRQSLGGRAFSFIDPQTGDPVDNGQHLFMGCYRATQTFLKRIGTIQQMYFQSNLSADFVGASGFKARLSCWPLPSPLHLFSGLWRLSSLTWMDRVRLFHMYKAIRRAPKEQARLDSITVEQWLKENHQSDQARRHLWDLIAIATLNEDPAIAAAGPFATVLAQAFFRGRKNAQLGFSLVGLSQLYVEHARAYIERRGGEVRLKAPVDRLLMNGQDVVGVQLREGERLLADWVISSVPASAFLKLLPVAALAGEPRFQQLKQLRTAPIISIHLWFNKRITRRMFVGLLDTHVQWFFNKSAIFSVPRTKQGYVSTVISGAHKFIDWDDNRLLTLALEELRRLFPEARKALLVRSLVIKEHHATLSPEVGSEALRPAYQSPYPHLLLAGDWVKTGLPATIESACVSGHACADIIISNASSAAASSGGSKMNQEIPRSLPRGMTKGEVAHA